MSQIHLLEKSAPNVNDEMELTSKKEVTGIVEKMKNVGAGYDDIGARIFKCAYMAIIYILVHFVNTCLINPFTPFVAFSQRKQTWTRSPLDNYAVAAHE